MSIKHPVIVRKGLRKTPTIVEKSMGYVHDPKNKMGVQQVKPLLAPTFAASRILQKTGPTLDQNGYPACVGFAFTSNQMRDEKIEHNAYYFSNADALDLYLECKKIDGYAGDGTYGGAAVQVLRDRGVRSSGRWILTVPNLWKSAIWKAWDTPKFYKITTSQVLFNNANDICSMIDTHRRPVLVGMRVDNQIYYPPATGILPSPNGHVIGGHEMEIYGYNINLNGQGLHFAIKNSWSAYWGGGGGLQGGRIWMPVSWLNQYDPDFYVTTDVGPD